MNEWLIRNPRFEIRAFDEGWWYWTLVNDGKEVASASAAAYTDHWTEQVALESARWLKFAAADVPIIGGSGIVEL